MKNIKIAVIGGDIRMYYAGKDLESNGAQVCFTGFEKIGAPSCSEKELSGCSCVLLPVPLTRDSRTLFAPLSDKKILLDKDLPLLIKSKTVFCCMENTLKRFCSIGDSQQIFDYYNAPGFAEKNAVLTADAAVSIIHSETNASLVGKKVLILGYGRVGRECARAVKEDFADIYVGVRRKESELEVIAHGFTPVSSINLENMQKYDLIINTVPYTLLNTSVLDKINKSTLIIDLASDGGGTDFKHAEKSGLKAIYAQGLPGKYYPEKAGRIISQTISQFTGGL